MVRINDRGPFHKDRIIDLSYAAAYKLGFIAKGSSLVEVEAIDPKLAANYKSQVLSNQTVSSKPVDVPASVVVAQSTNANVADISGYFVQVAAFKSQESANRMRDKVKLELLFAR